MAASAVRRFFVATACIVAVHGSSSVRSSSPKSQEVAETVEIRTPFCPKDRSLGLTIVKHDKKLTLNAVAQNGWAAIHSQINEYIGWRILKMNGTYMRHRKDMRKAQANMTEGQEVVFLLQSPTKPYAPHKKKKSKHHRRTRSISPERPSEHQNRHRSSSLDDCNTENKQPSSPEGRRRSASLDSVAIENLQRTSLPPFVPPPEIKTLEETEFRTVEANGGWPEDGQLGIKVSFEPQFKVVGVDDGGWADTKTNLRDFIGWHIIKVNSLRNDIDDKDKIYTIENKGDFGRVKMSLKPGDPVSFTLENRQVEYELIAPEGAIPGEKIKIDVGGARFDVVYPPNIIAGKPMRIKVSGVDIKASTRTSHDDIESPKTPTKKSPKSRRRSFSADDVEDMTEPIEPPQLTEIELQHKHNHCLLFFQAFGIVYGKDSFNSDALLGAEFKKWSDVKLFVKTLADLKKNLTNGGYDRKDFGEAFSMYIQAIVVFKHIQPPFWKKILQPCNLQDGASTLSDYFDSGESDDGTLSDDSDFFIEDETVYQSRVSNYKELDPRKCALRCFVRKLLQLKYELAMFTNITGAVVHPNMIRASVETKMEQFSEVLFSDEWCQSELIEFWEKNIVPHYLLLKNPAPYYLDSDELYVARYRLYAFDMWLKSAASRLRFEEREQNRREAEIKEIRRKKEKALKDIENQKLGEALEIFYQRKREEAEQLYQDQLAQEIQAHQDQLDIIERFSTRRWGSRQQTTTDDNVSSNWEILSNTDTIQSIQESIQESFSSIGDAVREAVPTELVDTFADLLYKNFATEFVDLDDD